jgi:hypothetical protein
VTIVTVLSVEPGAARIRRGADRWPIEHRPALFQGYSGAWELCRGGRHVRWFERQADARAWLRSDEGRAWLDSLPTENATEVDLEGVPE